ncbi:hypothetical protein [Nocardia huaxiensis]|uniref:hypothetical protein n=1 Tax=Nocardia huaxiensis TaxID=2755382 RepID=UPI001E45AC08|nr:hypothetical protein [Nocardia huaxiensis]UFS94710.1 hypothetical protein LPY97_28810 [Nocardia huaxiensis]
MATTVTGLTHEDCGTIGFVLSCLFDQVIDIAELRTWCEHVIITNAMEDIPQYIFDLASVDDISKVSGVPSDSDRRMNSHRRKMLRSTA